MGQSSPKGSQSVNANTLFQNSSQTHLSRIAVPDEILFEVFEYLETNELLRNRRVCKYWNGFVRKSQFQRMVIRERTVPVPELLGKFKELTVVKLINCKLTVQDINALTTRKYLINCKELDLSGSSIGIEGLKKIANSNFLCKNLTSLNLANNLLGDSFVSLLTTSPNLSQLKHLDLSGNEIVNNDFEAIASSIYLKQLTSLKVLNIINKGSAKIEIDTLLKLEKHLDQCTDLIIDTELIYNCKVQCVKQNRKQDELHCLELGMKQNHAPCIHDYALMLMKIPERKSECIKYFEIGSNLNYPPSTYILGKAYEVGYNTKKDRKKAFELIKKAADDITEASSLAHTFEASAYLGECYATGKLIPKDYSKAAHYFKMNQDHAPSIIGLAELYLEGKGVPKDVSKAFNLFKRAFDIVIERMDSTATIATAKLYLEGKGVERSVDKAIQILETTAISDAKDANIFLGDLYFNGEFVTKDLNKAEEYYKKDATSPKGLAKLGDLYSFSDVEKAISYYQRSNSLEHSQFRLGQIFYERSNLLRQDNTLL